MITSIDLFSGPGGLCTGMKWAGIKPLIAVEFSYWTAQTYSKTHNAEIFDLEKYLNNELSNVEEFFKPSDRSIIIYGDITKVEDDLIMNLLRGRFNRDTVDLVTGGAPCESFSLAGKRLEDDHRDVLFENIKRIASVVESKMILFENVKGLLSKRLNGKKGAMFKYVCDFFEDKKHYNIKFKLASRKVEDILLNSADYGVPQLRERLFLIGINSKFDIEFNYPQPTHGDKTGVKYNSVKDAIFDLPKIKAGEEGNIYNGVSTNEFVKIMRGETLDCFENIEFDKSLINDHKAVKHREKMIKRMSYIKQGEGMKKSAERLINEGKVEIVNRYFPNKLYAARNRRLRIDKPSFTVTSHCLDEMIHPIEDRGLTPREVARLQSFPDWYIFQGPFVKFHSDPEQDRYEQIGDAIPPLLAFNISKEIVKAIENIQ